MSFFYISDATDDGTEGPAEDAVVLAAGGELDFEASPQLRERIADQLNAGKRRVVLDLSAVTFIDSTAIGALVGAAMRMREHDEGSIAVACSDDNRRVLRIFDIAGVESMVALYPSREEALSALATAA